MPVIEYPVTRESDALEVLAGVEFADPYRWLEGNTPEVQLWQQAQGELAARHVRQWPHFQTLRQSVSRFYVARLAALPRVAGTLWFRIAPAEGTSQPGVIVAETRTGGGRTLFDPVMENPASPPFLSWISPSPDGRVLAVGVCKDGSENNTMRLIDVGSGAQLPAPTQVLMDGWLGGAQWLADSSGFYFTALSGSVHDFRQAIYFYRLGDPRPTSPAAIPVPKDSRDYRGVMISRCGRWAVAIHRIANPVPVALRDLSDPNSEWRPFVTDVAELVAGHIIEGRYVAVTHVGAPRGRIVALPLDCATPNDPRSWVELVSESEAVIRNLTPVGDRLYVSELIDTYARVRMVATDGAPLGEVPLPGRGAVLEMGFPMLNLFAKGLEGAYLFGFSTLTRSAGLYLHRPGSEHLETISEPEVSIDGAVIEDHWATSADGTRIAYHLVRLERSGSSAPRPTLMAAYGAAGVPFYPQFWGPAAAFVAAGGLYVHGHLRGGGEFGLEWWRAGTLRNRQNSYADVIAIAEDLIDRGVTVPQALALTGGSAGGLMTGVAITQRPDLWRVAVPRVPVIDLIGGCREPYLSFVASVEYGDIRDPEEVRRIAGFSPYHLIKRGIAYPAVFIDAGDTDPRCPPWHARKFAARLQAAQTAHAPILLHVWANAGHGWATAREILLEEQAEWLAFVMQQLGIRPLNGQ
jgi:prolyl oligopeptidase